MLEIQFSNIFKKDFKRCLKRGYRKTDFMTVLDLLINELPLPARYKDHQLTDSKRYQDVRECHINPDWLFIYRIQKELRLLQAIRIGSHSDLF
jgi:mRNA interferase YafQ